MDKFLKWIEKHKKHRALTDSSYKKVYQERYRKGLDNTRVNTELATYGDAVLKLALCEILWKDKQEKPETLTEIKQKYESDEVLVNVIARYYDILKYLRFDETDGMMPKDYDYEDKNEDKKSKRKPNKHKYIATAIEACLGAMDMDEKISWKDIIKIVKEWKKLIDGNN